MGSRKNIVLYETGCKIYNPLMKTTYLSDVKITQNQIAAKNRWENNRDRYYLRRHIITQVQEKKTLQTEEYDSKSNSWHILVMQ